MKIRKADFVKSAVYEKDYPEQLDKMEFAFLLEGLMLGNLL